MAMAGQSPCSGGNTSPGNRDWMDSAGWDVAWGQEEGPSFKPDLLGNALGVGGCPRSVEHACMVRCPFNVQDYRRVQEKSTPGLAHLPLSHADLLTEPPTPQRKSKDRFCVPSCKDTIYKHRKQPLAAWHHPTEVLTEFRMIQYSMPVSLSTPQPTTEITWFGTGSMACSANRPPDREERQGQ